MAEEESGLDELLRLSQQFTRQQEEHEKQERQREEQGKKVQGVLQGLKALNFNMALEQLTPVASPETIHQVSSLRDRGDTENLRKIITTMADDLENQLGTLSSTRSEAAPLVDSMRTLSILMDLYFSLQ